MWLQLYFVMRKVGKCSNIWSDLQNYIGYGIGIYINLRIIPMPRTYSDFSLPNLEPDLDSEKRTLLKRKLLIHKKKYRNIARPNRKKSKQHKRSLKKTHTYKRAFSPEYKIQIFDEDSASFQSDCIDRRSDQELFDDRKDDAIPYLSLQNDQTYDRLREACQRRELIAIMKDCRLCEQDQMNDE